MSKKKILIVDDDKTTAAVMKLYLTNFGYEVPEIATNGREAINMAKNLRPDLVLMDIHLGKGLDGIDAADIIYHHFEVPIAFVTSHADQATLERAKSVKPVGYINKPLRETDLKTTIEIALAKTPPRNRARRDPKASLEEILISLYSLTRAEAKVAARLIEFPDLSYAAEALNVSMETIRTHVKRIYRKTDTNRLSILVHKIMTGPVGLLLNKKD